MKAKRMYVRVTPYILVLKSAKKTSAKKLGCAYYYLAEK